jgi:hypothetical protein
MKKEVIDLLKYLKDKTIRLNNCKEFFFLNGFFEKLNIPVYMNNMTRVKVKNYQNRDMFVNAIISDKTNMFCLGKKSNSSIINFKYLMQQESFLKAYSLYKTKKQKENFLRYQIEQLNLK